MIKGAIIERTKGFKTLTNKLHKKILFAAKSKGRSGPARFVVKVATLIKIHFTSVF